MEIKEIVRIQKEFDSRHGWNLNSDDIKVLIDYLNQDSIGLLGELGEFANHIKKLNILKNYDDKLLNEFGGIKESLKSELTDIFIYIIRLATHLEVDLERQYLNKLSKNEIRFKVYEK